MENINLISEFLLSVFKQNKDKKLLLFRDNYEIVSPKTKVEIVLPDWLDIKSFVDYLRRPNGDLEKIGLEIITEKGKYIRSSDYYDWGSGTDLGEPVHEELFYIQKLAHKKKIRTLNPNFVKSRIFEIQDFEDEKKELLKTLQQECDHDRVVVTQYKEDIFEEYSYRGVCIDCWKMEESHGGLLEALKGRTSVWITAKEFDTYFDFLILGQQLRPFYFVDRLGKFEI